MTITAASNVASVRAQRQLESTTRELGTTFERLSSGLRINSAKDDPAGLALADSLRADARIASVATRNANDGISVTSVTDAALGEISNILTRMLELATQSANGVYSVDQRSALSSEFIALGSEIERIAVTTEFNGIKLISSSQTINFQVGFDGSSNSRISVTGVQATLASLGLAAAGSSSLTFSIIGTTSTAAETAAALAIDQVTAALSSLNSRRGIIGAAESRLNVAINYLTAARENFIAAESRIRDADIATETANLVRLQVLQQAGTAVLAQANQQPSLVLKLLQ
jgi:flagellin